MGRGGRVDLRQLKAFERKLAKLATADYEKFCEDCAKELAARLLGKVIRRTPVAKVDGGTLRRGWTIGQVKKSGSVYEIEVINPVEYAQYVEFGHRTSNHQGWVPGRFMMTISADQVEQQAPTILQKKLYTMLKEAFNGD
ncbi:HK97 gp10 family phage protein [Lysinibacillus mangiferihumi]|uniref:HK97 gp10 family phage protein n=1 Tax=Lysinibacillus mangiferihumi TaxID=1130819 RepID=A0A4V5TLH3_9BACI|nr:HK97 gp10 family phage protein [Lysinibacillus mangiferihumi]TKI66623.1 HK97 gp10 family phage protein [Lysinibacillus mangiferihumi]